MSYYCDVEDKEKSQTLCSIIAPNKHNNIIKEKKKDFKILKTYLCLRFYQDL